MKNNDTGNTVGELR